MFDCPYLCSHLPLFLPKGTGNKTLIEGPSQNVIDLVDVCLVSRCDCTNGYPVPVEEEEEDPPTPEPTEMPTAVECYASSFDRMRSTKKDDDIGFSLTQDSCPVNSFHCSVDSEKLSENQNITCSVGGQPVDVEFYALDGADSERKRYALVVKDYDYVLVNVYTSQPSEDSGGYLYHWGSDPSDPDKSDFFGSYKSGAIRGPDKFSPVAGIDFCLAEACCVENTNEFDERDEPKERYDPDLDDSHDNCPHNGWFCNIALDASEVISQTDIDCESPWGYTVHVDLSVSQGVDGSAREISIQSKDCHIMTAIYTESESFNLGKRIEFGADAFQEKTDVPMVSTCQDFLKHFLLVSFSNHQFSSLTGYSKQNWNSGTWRWSH